MINATWLGLVFLATTSVHFPYGQMTYDFKTEEACWSWWDNTFTPVHTYTNFYHSKFTLKKYSDPQLGVVFVTCIDQLGEK